MKLALSTRLAIGVLIFCVSPSQAFAALQYVGGTSGARAGSASAGITLTLSSGLTGGIASAAAAGDIVIVVQSTGSTADRDITMSTAGYTELFERYSNDTFDTNFAVFWKIMGASPDASAVTGPSGSTADGQSATVHVWRGVDISNVFSVASTSNVGIDTGRPTPPPITPAHAGSIVIAMGAGAAGAGANYTTGTLSNFISNTGADTNDSMTAMGSFAWSSGTYTPAQFGGGTTGTGDSWASQTIALRPATTPTLTTQAESDVTGSSATVNGTITSTGEAYGDVTVRGFAWGTNAALSGGDTATTTENGTFGTGAFTGALSSLTCNTTYYSRPYATNDIGTGVGTIDSFTTSACPPTVTTQAASGVGETSATLNGTITATGGANASVRGFAWGTNAALSGGDTATTTENGTFGTGAFTESSLTLTCNTTYYARAYATNSGGTGFGSISASFTTSACPAAAPTVATNAASAGVAGATLNGTISATGGQNATVRGFAWGTVSNLSGGDTSTTTESGSFGTGAFSRALINILSNKTYYVRAYATNPAGTGYGSIESFTTGTNTLLNRLLLLFQGSRIKLPSGKLIINQK